ncbi:phosphoribosylaminoimidazolesuccinocarboxamide synthase [bacterium]|nr:phosphoribosylaminoimidazolesuccinocarboxamide synthase [bacterium]MBU1153870.1 phosphoribosylaminoimidazolesuccinocarboxamide synthase [bacterium]
MSSILRELKDINLKIYKKGKVREVFDLEDKLLIVATDRISAFDVILPNGIPDKGKILTKISLYWFNQTKEIVNNHLITTDVELFPQEVKVYQELLKDRAMLVKKASLIEIECVVRGYLSGSSWKEYQESQSICGIKLPPGLKESEKLPEIIFTPATKAKSGHDLNISLEETAQIVGRDLIEKLKEISIKLYKFACCKVEPKGLIIADTKFEFGLIGDKIVLIDEILTPDSSRFWSKDKYLPGQSQKSFDKQFIRDYLESINWNMEPPAPVLPEWVIKETSHKYKRAYEIITGEEFNS